MSGIKRTPADAAFSLCVRERAGWRCERCGAQHSRGSMGLHCSHHHSRRSWSIRFEPLAAEALCYGCHSLTGGTEERRREVLTEQQRALLLELKEDRNRGRECRRTQGKGDIAKHYRDEHRRMVETGSRQFVGWL